MLKGRASLSLSMIPDEWAIENGYAERAVGGYSRSGPGREFRRWNPGIDEEAVLFHYLYGRPAPVNRGSYERGVWVDDPQWTYPRGAGKTRAEQKATALRLTEVEQLVAA